MEITKIVITGGPCAGKSTAMSWIQNYFTKLGYKVLFVPETATELISGGVAPWTCGTNAEYQKCQVALQIFKEKTFLQGGSTMPCDKLLLVCDRGALDNKAYMNDAEFAYVLDCLKLNEVELRDEYDAVFHMVTAAKGAEQFYTLENNGARIETVDEAVALDDRIIAAWTGHPHLRIIDNDTDFEAKLRRLIGEIAAFLGVEGPYETKRRFLIDYPDVATLEAMKNCRRVEIIQTYLKSDSDTEIRVRQRGIDGHYIYFETKRRLLGGGKRIESERRLTKDEYLRLLMESDPDCRPIRKTRYCLTYKNQYFEIDLYPFFTDRAVMEIEITAERENEPIVFPDFVAVRGEITDDPAYNNAAIAKGAR